MSAYSYEEAFSRNLGWVTPAEQARLRQARVSIAGLGGVGGVYLLTLARLGIGRFSVAEFDHYALANFNRQVGATVASIDRPKLDVMLEMARDINPALDVRVFDRGLDEDNLDAFLDGADVYLDGLDFFALQIRQRTFARCHAKAIPAVTVAPLGLGAALLNFVPGKMSFEDYFGFDGQSEDEQALRFLVGLSPAMLQMGYLVAPEYVNFRERRGPSTVIGPQLCSGIAAAQVLKLVLQRGEVLAAPWGLHFDAYRNRMRRTWRPGGHRHPLQRLLRAIARRKVGAA